MKLEKRIWHIGTLITLLLALLSLRIPYWQLVRGQQLQPVVLDPLASARKDDNVFRKGNKITEEALKYLTGSAPQGEAESMPAPVVQRTRELLGNIARGSIYDDKGRLLAYDYIDDQGERTRFYTEPSLAQVIGYVSGLRTGIAGLELTYNNSLLGLNSPLSQLEQTLHQPITGSDLRLTIDSRVQRAAEQALGDRTGAVVVLDGHSGAVLAMTSSPRFDPNRMQDIGYVSSLSGDCGPNPDCSGVFINRATQGLYTPGSTFKTVTLIAGLDSGQVTPDTVIDFGKPVSGPNGSYFVYRVDGGVIPDPNHKESRLSLPLCYAKSANAAFARIAAEMPPETLIGYAQRLGFSNPDANYFPLELPYNPSQLANDVDSLRSNNLLRAATGIGQGELLASPLNMAMLVTAVLNNGDMPVPYLVDSVHDSTGLSHNGQVKGRVIRNTMKDKTAEEVKDMMVTVVTQGYGSGAAVKGMTVGGKTGTAQLGGSAQPHAWFIGFAEEGDRSVAIAVLVENAGQGSTVAAPIFAQVAQAAIRQLGQPVDEVLALPPPANGQAPAH
jgi:peptidoglycan glycosyltransferase